MVAQDIEAWTAKPMATRLGERDEADVRWFWNEAEAEFGMRSNFGMQIEMLQLYAVTPKRGAPSEDTNVPRKIRTALAHSGLESRGLRQHVGADGKPKTSHVLVWANPWTDRRIDCAGRYRFIYDVMTSLDVGHMRALWLVYGPELDEVRGCIRRLTRKEGPDPRRDDPVMRPHYARLGDLTLVAEDTDEARAVAADMRTTPRLALGQRVVRDDILRMRVRIAAEKTVVAACHAYAAARGPEKRRDESWARYRRRRTTEVV